MGRETRCSLIKLRFNKQRALLLQLKFKEMKRYIILLIILLLNIVGMPSMSYGRSRVVVKQDDDVVTIFSGKNQRYIIKEDIDLHEKKVVIGDNSILEFRGGSLANGVIVGSNTRVIAKNYEIFKRGYIRYRACIKAGAKQSSPPTLLKEYHSCLFIEGTWNNKKCGSNWTGLQNGSEEDVMPALRNYIALHKAGVKVTVPYIDVLGYESTFIPGGHQIDFSNSTISYPDDLSKWEDKNITLPTGATHNPLESFYGLLCMSSNTRISNLNIDGKSFTRQDEVIRLGVSCIISIGNAKNVFFENVNIKNVLGPGVTAEYDAEDVTFKNCIFYNIGEHIVYSHQYKGFCHFEGCEFDTWDSERLSVFRNGFNYIYKYDPPKTAAPYDEVYSFDLSFNNCHFKNPTRRNSQNRLLGGFVTSTFPLEVKVNNCVFEGSMPPFNPTCSEELSEETGKGCLLIVRNCDGAPYVYPVRGNYNIIVEYYDCVNIPFRTVNTRRYERCDLILDIYEDNIENVSSSFLKEFAKPLTIIDCTFKDSGKATRINHPVNHRPVYFKHCSFIANNSKDEISSLLCFSTNKKHPVTFDSCLFDLEGYRLVGNNNVELSIHNCRFIKAIDLPDRVKLDCNMKDVL